MKILGQEIKPGQNLTLSMSIAKLNTRASVEVPIVISRGKKEGPCLLLIAGIHGDEVNGSEIVRQIISKKFNRVEKGTTICIPLVNVPGFITEKREFPDGRDLNRVFPGSKNGSLASRYAYHLMKEIVPHVDYCIDFHTGGAQRYNEPQIRINKDDKETLELAKSFSANFILYAPNREKTFREALVKLNKKVLLFEGGKSLFLDEKITNIGLQGAINILKYLGMKKSEEAQKPTSSIIINSSKWIRAKHSGMFRSKIKEELSVLKSEKLGSISDVFGEFEKDVKNPQDGYIICTNHSPIVNQGDALFHIGFTTSRLVD